MISKLEENVSYCQGENAILNLEIIHLRKQLLMKDSLIQTLELQVHGGVVTSVEATEPQDSMEATPSTLFDKRYSLESQVSTNFRSTRLKKTVSMIPEDDPSTLCKVLLAGEVFLKWGISGRPCKHFLWVSEDLCTLSLGDILHEPMETFELSEVQQVYRGLGTNALSIVTDDPSRVFTVTFATQKNEPLVFEADTVVLCGRWVQCLKALVELGEDQRGSEVLKSVKSQYSTLFE